jgi:hypothetical protein
MYSQTCLRAIATCTPNTPNGHVCINEHESVIVMGLSELMNNISSALEFTTNDILFKKHLVPKHNSQYDIGTAESKLRHLFLSDS